MVKNICVAGAGTMGSGIALVAAKAGLPVLLFDLDNDRLERAETYIQQTIQHLTSRQKIRAAEGAGIASNIRFTTNGQECIADLFIEAIIEDVTAKINLFNLFAAFNEAAIFATNTSSLSISMIQSGVIRPQRVIGMHFFNPAPVMKLVEIVRGKQTSESTAQTIYELCRRMDKTPVYCNDAPGFIVNRIARHYYLEAMRLVSSGVAGIEEVDDLMEASGFKMGPFRLMDLIGLDINLAVTSSIYEAFDRPDRFAPSEMQKEKVALGELGKKTGKGFYTYHP